MTAIARDVLFGGDGRVLAGLDGILLSRQPEAVISLGVQHIESTLSLVASNNIGSDVAQGVSHVQPSSTGVWEHVQYIVLGLVVPFLRNVRSVCCPACPPFGLDGLEVIFHCPRDVVAKIPPQKGVKMHSHSLGTRAHCRTCPCVSNPHSERRPCPVSEISLGGIRFRCSLDIRRWSTPGMDTVCLGRVGQARSKGDVLLRRRKHPAPP